nr:MAG TPA: hypothetical protein [Caudoviricetes sp.]
MVIIPQAISFVNRFLRFFISWWALWIPTPQPCSYEEPAPPLRQRPI